MTQANDAQASSSRATWIAVLATIAIFAYASFLSSRSSLFDREEPRCAEAAVEMLTTGNWLYPTFDFELRPDKPILVYWLTAGAIEAAGATAWAARFWSPVCLALACWLVFLMGRRLFDAKTGLIALGLLAVSPLALMQGVLATTDALFLLCIALTMSSFASIVVAGPGALRYFGVALGTAGALLTQGLVGLLIPAFSIAFTLWYLRAERTPARRDRMRVWLAVLAGVCVFLLWAIPANSATDGEYARALVRHIVGGRSEALEGQSSNYLLWLPYYVPIVVIGFLPALLFLPAACTAFLGEDVATVRSRALILGWALPCFVLMTLAPVKLPHNILPIFPALALGSAAVIGALERDQLSDRERAWFSSGTWIFGVVAILLAGVFGAASYLLEIEELLMPSIVLAAMVGAVTLVAMRLHRRGRVTSAAQVVIFGFALTWLAGALLVLPIIESTKVVPEIASAIRTNVPKSVTVARWKFTAPSLDFYLGRPPIKDFEDEGQLRAWAGEDSPAVLVIPRSHIEKLQSVLQAPRWTELASAKGVNLSKGVGIELVALVRALPATNER